MIRFKKKNGKLKYSMQLIRINKEVIACGLERDSDSNFEMGTKRYIQKTKISRVIIFTIKITDLILQGTIIMKKKLQNNCR